MQKNMLYLLSVHKNKLSSLDYVKKIVVLLKKQYQEYKVLTHLYLVTDIYYQEIIKVRERVPHKGTLTEVIPLELFLAIVTRSSADITRVLRGCFRGESVNAVSFR